MRFAVLLAAIAALWTAQPAKGAKIDMPQISGAAQRVTLFGLEKGDSFEVFGGSNSLVFYWWTQTERGWEIDGNEVGELYCSTQYGYCSRVLAFSLDHAPARAVGSIIIHARRNVIDVYWKEYATGAQTCLGVPEALRVEYRSCGMEFLHIYPFRLSLGFNGPAPANLTYTIETIKMASVPEPASWAMMILGFGFIGAAMRRARLTRNTRRASAGTS